MKNKFLTVTAAACAVALLLTATARAGTAITAKFAMPVQFKGTLGYSDCENSPGPTITLSGTLLLGGLNADAIFQNNEKFTHASTNTFVTNAVLVTAGGPIYLPKQPVQGGTGGNPYIWLQLLDGNNNALTTEIFLGRCVQGLTAVDLSVLADALAALDVGVSDCYNHPGPFITLSGGLVFNTGLKARIIFRNADNKVGGPHKADVVRDLTILAPGSGVEIPKQPPLGGAGGNPIISIQLRQGNGDAIGDLIVLGKCVQLSK
jgi:hypothetical protein